MSHGHDEHLKQTLAHLQRRADLLQDRVTLLEEENTSLAEKLREHGVNIHRKSHIHVDLPPALTEPAPANEQELALMNPGERRLLEEARGPDPLILVLLSETMVDVGQWIWKSRLWLGATPTDLLAVAVGRHPFLQRIPFRHIQESLYNHVTGELVLAPNRQFRLNRIQLAPLEGYQFLAQIYRDSLNAQSPEATHAR